VPSLGEVGCTTRLGRGWCVPGRERTNAAGSRAGDRLLKKLGPLVDIEEWITPWTIRFAGPPATRGHLTRLAASVLPDEHLAPMGFNTHSEPSVRPPREDEIESAE
jgi:hypothetical protein